MRGLKFKFKYKVTGGSRGGAREARAPLLFWVKKKKKKTGRRMKSRRGKEQKTTPPLSITMQHNLCDYCNNLLHLLPTHPKLFITVWHIHVAAKWQVLIKQSFQRFSVLFQGATLNWYSNETTSNRERKSLLCLWTRFQPCYICFLEWNWIAKI